MKPISEWTKEEETQYRNFRYRQQATVAQVDDELARMRALDADRIAQENAAAEYQRQRQAESDAMMRRYNEDNAGRQQQLEQSNLYWKPEEPFTPFRVVPPDPYGYGKPGRNDHVKGTAGDPLTNPENRSAFKK